MFRLFRYKKKGMAYGLTRVHDLLMEDTIDYFEGSRMARKTSKESRKAIRQAIKVAKKKKINPGVKLGRAREVLEEFRSEVAYTRRALRATCAGMEDMLNRIEEERVTEPLTLVEHSRELFREKQIDQAVDLLKKSQDLVTKKDLHRTRTALFGGIDSEVKRIRNELEEQKKK